MLAAPRRTATADRADLVLQPVPGTDLALALGLLHLLIAGGHVDETYVAARTTGFEAVRDAAAAWWPERVERVTDIISEGDEILVRVIDVDRHRSYDGPSSFVVWQGRETS